MSTVTRFKDLEVWQLARELENKIFILTKNTHLSRDFSLRDQMNKSSGSIMDNIAEGFGRASRFEFAQFLSIAKGSANELQSQLYRCLDRGYVSHIDFEKLYSLGDHICGKISTLIKYLNNSNIKGQKFKNRNK